MHALNARCIRSVRLPVYGSLAARKKSVVSSVKRAIVSSLLLLLSATFAPSQSSTKPGESTNPAASPPRRPAHSVSLTWTPSTSAAVTGYNIYRSSSKAGPYKKINSAVVIGTSYVDNDVLAGHTYYYVATAVNQQKAESRQSKEAYARVPTP